MKLEQLGDGLELLGLPVAYSHFAEKQTPPFLCYIVEDGDTFLADNKPIHDWIDVDIELYSTYKDLISEGKIKDFLRNNDLPWFYTEVYVKEDKIFKCTYTIRLI